MVYLMQGSLQQKFSYYVYDFSSLVVTVEMPADPMKYCFYFEYDFKCVGLNLQYILVFQLS